ncbi:MULTISPECIES: aspartyl protease family protein [unclassified Brevundimonas]|uniref:aspartyl protease family protein n=1 Tax=unclassified Brevundimonas TaxID=2622653 RepID=UPI0025BD538E|nr:MULTISPECIES: aspartyl protease family protein [unclassified Brevundimonas]
MNRRSFLLRGALAASAVGAGFWLKDRLWWGRPAIAFDGTQTWHPLVSAVVDVPVVEVRIEGRAVRALIDSGAQYSVMDQAFAQSLSAASFNMPVIAYGVGGQAQVGRGMTVDIDLPGARVSRLRTALLDLGPLARDPSIGVDLIIGRDLMRESVIELDWERKVVRFTSPESWKAPPQLWSAPVEMSGDALSAVVQVEGKPVRAVVDTGASSLLAVTEPYAQSIGLNDGRRAEEGTSLVLGGVTRARWVRVSTVTLGDKQWSDTRVAIFPASDLPGYPDALLGMAAFRNKKLALNLGQNQLFVSRDLDLTVG